MDGTRTVSVVPQSTQAQDGPRRHASVFRNIRVGTVAPRLSDARGSRSSFLRNSAVIVPHVLDMSGALRHSLFTRGSLALHNNVDNYDDDKRAGRSGKHQASAVPIPLPSRQPSHLEKSISMFGYSLAPLYDLWEQLQVSHCGQYSVERMLALDQYCQRTSFSRVLAVCFFTPLIPLVVVILIELIPLKPTEDGASANYVFWARHALTLTITVMCAELQATSWIPELPLPIRQALIIALGTAVMNMGMELLVAEFWVFPIPFLSVLGSPLLLFIWAIMSRMILRSNMVQGVQDSDFRRRRFLQIIAVQMSLLLIYPAYQAVFITVDGFLQLLVVSLLPVINLALKNSLVACGSHLEDNLPEMVVLTVDCFSALYSVICMRGTNSFKMVTVTVTLDAFVTVLSLHGMNRRSRVARESRIFHLMQIRQRQEQRTQSFLSIGGSPELLSTLVVTTLELLRAPGQLDPAELGEIRLLSGMQHKLSAANSALLQSLAARSVYHNDRRISQAISIAQMKSRYASVAIEGRALSTSHFPTPSLPPSRLVQRLRAAIRALPSASRRLGSEVGTKLGNFPSFRSSTRDKSNSKVTDTGSSADSFPRLPSVPQLTKAVKSSSRWIPERTSKLTPATASAMGGLAIDTSIKLRPLVMTERPIINGVLVETRRKNTRAVKQSLQLLFNNEYLGLIAYIQCVIPMLYVLYMPILQTLPNRVYYPTHFVLMEEVDQFQDRIIMIAVLALLQFIALGLLHVFVAARFAVSTIYQIAFVLETHFRLVEGRLLVWFIFAVQSTLVHYGDDFSFRFDWVHR